MLDALGQQYGKTPSELLRGSMVELAFDYEVMAKASAKAAKSHGARPPTAEALARMCS